MTREDVKNMLVFKEDCVIRADNENTAMPFEVVCADENVFVIAPISYNEQDDICTTDYTRLEAFSNDKSINTLDQIGLIVVNGGN